MLAVWLLSAATSGARIRRNELILSLLAGFGFGLFFICIDRVAEQAIVWPLVAARLASVTLLGAIFAVRRNIALPLRNQWSYIVLAGIFDTAGNTFFALASHVGRLDIAAVLASMYPASTVILARGLLKERLRPQQWLGVVVALVALALIAA
jgi:drug/metabolite transporter (DMT)-like permease